MSRRRKVPTQQRDKRRHPRFDKYVASIETGRFTVESDILPLVEELVKVLLRRYHGSEKHWTEGEEQSMFWGTLAELVFGCYLYQHEVPSIYNNPIFQQLIGKKPYDYRIPGIGSIEVKGVGPNPSDIHLLVKVSEWKGSNYVVALKFESEERGWLAGWLTREEVEKLPKGNFGYGECYYRPLDELRPFKEFNELLLQNVQGPLSIH